MYVGSARHKGMSVKKKDEDDSILKTSTHALDGRKDEFQSLFKRSAKFTEELLRENERLRYALADYESRDRATANDQPLLHELLAKVKRLEEERQELLDRFAHVEAENRDFASRYVEIEEENSRLMNIYVASYQLHSTLDFNEVLKTLTEIILNFIGSDRFMLGLLDEKQQELRPLIIESIDNEAIIKNCLTHECVRRVLVTEEPFFEELWQENAKIKGPPIVCIPLKLRDKLFGLLCIYSFFRQKKQLSHVDRELFTLLAAQAATAIFSAKLYGESIRKLNTLQGFIDLISQGQTLETREAR